MDTILLLKALILGIVEGLTEFLPISSTGHLNHRRQPARLYRGAEQGMTAALLKREVESVLNQVIAEISTCAKWLNPKGQPWPIAIEEPLPDRHQARSIS